VVIVPIYKGDEGLQKISEAVAPLKKALEAKGISVKYDNRDTQRPGWKFAEYELKGVPVRLGIGERDLQNGTVEVARRDLLTKEVMPLAGIEDKIEKLLHEIQENLFAKALKRREESMHAVNTYEEFKQALEKGGFVAAHWDGTAETEQKIKEETKATIRCIPLNNKKENGKCIFSGKPSEQRVLFAIAY
jgi:prolyl-tRNA synthetase